MTFKKYFQELIVRGITPSRFMMHRALEDKMAHIIAPCVDLGGGNPQAQTYLKFFTYDTPAKVLLADITPEADVYCDLEKTVPFENDRFKTVLLINVLCLVFNYEVVIREVYRILEKGGKAYIWTSLNANTHPHPNDYFRFTDQALVKIFGQTGFSRVEVYPYGGIGLTIGTYMGQLTQKIKPVATLIYLVCFGFNKVVDLVRPKKNAQKWPLGYLCIVTK